jgi:hypothetical protein
VPLECRRADADGGPTFPTQGGSRATIGAMLSGRRTYDLVSGWKGSHPIGGVHVFVVTHAREPNVTHLTYRIAK